MKKSTWYRDLLVMLAALCVAGVAVVWVQRITGRIDGVAMLIFMLAVFVTSMYTDGYLWGVLASLASVLAVNFAFFTPYFAFNFTLPENLFSGLVMLAVSIMTSTLTTRVKKQEQLRMETEREKMRANLLRAVSHDLRTPLTLIADPVERLSACEGLTEEQRFYLEMIRRNARILLRMTEQILDFRKYENGKLELHPGWIDLAACCREWSKSFEVAAAGRAVEFRFDADAGADFRIYADEEKLERVYYNLLSNAFKFTPRGGRVTVALERGEEDGLPHIRLSVTNSGSHIAPEECGRIFDRFYQTGYRRGGAGIGLALSKTFVEMHGGRIGVESDRERGTCFRITLPVGSRETPPGIIPAACGEPRIPVPAPESPVTDGEPGPEEAAVQILIVDDNPDIRNYLHRMLGGEYHVRMAADGSEGLEKAVKYIPDLIISDVMMPRIDGVEYCRRLKQGVETCHIPVILLTACALDEQCVDGLQSGADAYVTKPFSSVVLLATVRSLLENRAKLRQYYAGQEIPDNDTTPAGRQNGISRLDRKFLDRVHTFVESRLDDSGIGVDEIAREIGMSRAQFYRKLKALTDCSPNEYVRVIRLRRAAGLLTEEGLTVAEVAYRVGFGTPSYFTKCFKAFFGELPTDYQRRFRGTEENP